jgi:hypothetical protein
MQRLQSLEGKSLVGDDEISERRQIQYGKEIDKILAEQDPEWSQLYPYIMMPTVNPNRTAPDTKFSTLHRVAYAGEQGILNWCLENNAEVDQQTNLGRTALHYACDSNKAECVRELLKAKADWNLVTLAGCTALHVCCQNNSYDALVELLKVDGYLEIDAEDSQRHIPEQLTKNRKMQEALQKYREVRVIPT